MKDLTEDDLKKEFSSFCCGLTKVDNKWYFFWELLEKDGEKYDKKIT